MLVAGCPVALAALALDGSPGLDGELRGADLTALQACPCGFAINNEQPQCRNWYRSMNLERLETFCTKSPCECHMAGSSAHGQCVLQPVHMKEQRIEGLLNDEMDLSGPAERDQPRPQFASLSHILYTVM